VMPPSRINVASMLPGLVVAVGAVEGQHVQRGDLLVQLNDGDARAQLAQAKAAVSQASARVEQLRHVGAIVASQSLKEADSNLEKAKANQARMEALAKSGGVTDVERDDAQRALEIAQAQRTAAEAQQLGTLGADSRVSMSALLEANAQQTGAEVRLAQTRLTAARSGVILSRSVEPGDTVQPARTLLTLAAEGDVELVFQADERNLSTLAVGQTARASADAFAQQPFDAVVHYIAPGIDPQRGTVELRLRVAQPPAFLKPDMTISIDVTVATRASALVVPSEAVRGITTDKPYALAIDDGRAVRRDLLLGIRGEGSVEITGGLVAGDVVILPDGQRIAPGQKVRAAPVEL